MKKFFEQWEKEREGLVEFSLNADEKELDEALAKVVEEFGHMPEVICYTSLKGCGECFFRHGFLKDITHYVLEYDATAEEPGEFFEAFEMGIPVNAGSEYPKIYFDEEDEDTECVRIVNAEEEIIAECVLSFDNETVCLSEVFVDEAYRRQGLATRLIQAVKDYCAGMKLLLHVSSDNEGAVALYEKCEFRVEEELLSYKRSETGADL